MTNPGIQWFGHVETLHLPHIESSTRLAVIQRVDHFTEEQFCAKVADRMWSCMSTKSRSLSLEIVPLTADQPSTGVFVSVD